MIKYVKLYNEFLGFLHASSLSALSDHEKKLVNLILSNFDSIAEASTAQGKRAKLLNNLIQKDGKDTVSEISNVENDPEDKIFPFVKLDHIKICQFRGFSQEEIIKFDKKFTFIYGPNGSGKSSLCEALEYSMLGYINEAISKRINIEKYIRNSVTGKYSYPVLKGINRANEPITIKHNPSVYYFCFIEKSRIENFARISANTPNDKQNLLSSLFGLNEFNEFVNNFTESIDKYIDIKGVNSDSLKQKSANLVVHQENIDKAQETLKTIESEKQKIIADSKLNFKFDSLNLCLHGDGISKGRIGEIEETLNQNIPDEYSFQDTSELENTFNNIDAAVSSCIANNREYEDNRNKICFRNLFSSTLQIESLSQDKCPVCETSISRTVKHPYDHARARLQELADVAVLEEKRDNTFNELDLSVQAFKKIISNRIETATKLSLKYAPIDTEIFGKAKSDFNSFADKYLEFKAEYFSNKPRYIDFDKEIERINTHNKNQRSKKTAMQEEKTILLKISKQITDVNSRETTIKGNVASWEKAIEDFKKDNEKLIKDAEIEKDIILENIKYVIAYHSFLSKLKEYKDNLPIRHLEKLNKLTLELYNAINMHDKIFEKVSTIKLPSSTEDSILLSFADCPGQEHDALHVLSEGHIRCLGLAILLAKNINDECPVIIFDDVVNAIDDDHRGGVRNLIFNNHYFLSKQIILTTHAEQFIKEIEQHVSINDYDKLVGKMTFLPDSDKRLIRIKHNTTQNYLKKAKGNIDEAEWSEALYNCRCSLENIAQHLWKKLGRNKFKTEFSVIIRTPNGSPELMSVVIALNKFLKMIDEKKEYENTILYLDYFLGLKTQSDIIWSYLNKGAHEQEGKIEFDQMIVKEMFDKLMLLDDLLKSKQTQLNN